MESPRVLVTANVDVQDAAMMDIGEKVRPPGDPPDASGSWVTKVTGSLTGRMPTPESVLDDDFVAARLRLEFPDGEEGEPVITIGEEVLEAMNGLWKRFMIVKVLGRHVPISVLSRKLKEMWEPKGEMYVMDLPRQFFIVRFELEEEYLMALTGGPWRVFGNYLMVQYWSLCFDPLRGDIVTTQVWVKLTNIPVNYYHKLILMGIARGLGRPIRVDMTTLNIERARFARICVEVNLSKPLKGTMLINGERYFVACEGLMNICSSCGIYCHLVHSCPKRTVVRAVVSEESNGVTGGSILQQKKDEFTVVRRHGRRSPAHVDKMVFAAVPSDGGTF